MYTATTTFDFRKRNAKFEHSFSVYLIVLPKHLLGLGEGVHVQATCLRGDRNPVTFLKS